MLRKMILVVAALLAGCADQSQTAISVDQAARGTFEVLPGEFGVAIHGADQTFQVLLKRGQVEPAPRPIRAPREATGMIGPSGATMLPDRPSEYYQGPYAISPDARYVAASLVGRQDTAALPQAFVIFDRHTNRDIARVALTGEELLRALAWSPDSKRIAILKSTSRGRTSLKNIISAVSGHSVPYDTYFLDVYDRDGRLIAHSKLVEDVRSSWGEITWTAS